MSGPIQDINQTIVSAINARTEALVAEAMMNDETFSKFVTAALQQPIQVGEYSNKRTTTFLRHTLEGAIETRTKALVGEVISEQDEAIKTAVRSALQQSIGVIAESLVDGFVANASGRHPSIKVEFRGD